MPIRRRHRPDPARRWALAAFGVAASVGAGALIGSNTVSAMDPFYRFPSWGGSTRPVPVIQPTQPPPITYSPVRTPDFAMPPVDLAPYDDPVLLAEPDRYSEPDWTPPPFDDEPRRVPDYGNALRADEPSLLPIPALDPPPAAPARPEDPRDPLQADPLTPA